MNVFIRNTTILNPKLPYHILNACMIAGGVGFILTMLGLTPFLYQLKIVHFLMLIGVAIALKYFYGFAKSEVKDPMTDHPMARRFFFLSMAVLATALVMRRFGIAYYNVLLYVDIVLQVVALGISFSAKTSPRTNEEILDL